MLTYKNKVFLLAGFVGAIAALLITLAIYLTFFQNFLEKFNDLSPEVVKLISREHPILTATLLANLAHGFLLATVIRWGKLYTLRGGAMAGSVIAFLTEIYFCFTQYAMFKTMTAPSAIFDTLMWTLINAIVGALVALILKKGETKGRRIAA